MSAFLNLLYSRFKQNVQMLYAAIAFIVIFSAAYYIYNYIYVPNQKNAQFSNVANANPNGQVVTIYMFHVDWCPHCKKAMPEWQMFSDEYNGKVLNGFQISCIDVDCTDTSDAKVKAATDKYSVKQYPTIIAVVPGQGGKENRVDYDAKVKKANLEKFVMSVSTEHP